MLETVMTIPLGGLIPVAVLLPNILFLLRPPVATDLPPGGPQESQLLTGLERIGQIGTFGLPFFYPVHVVSSSDRLALLLMGCALAVYYVGWARYVAEGRHERLFYAPLLGIPLPMAVMPVVYFAVASYLLGSVWLALAVAVFAVGHIGVSRVHLR
jgi:hypothetical protein